MYRFHSVLPSNYKRKQQAEIKAQVELTRSPPCGYCGLSVLLHLRSNALRPRNDMSEIDLEVINELPAFAPSKHR